MHTVTYRFERPRKHSALLYLVLILNGLAVAILLTRVVLKARRSNEGLVEIWSQEPVLVSLLALGLLLCLLLAGVGLLRHLRPSASSNVFLRLNEEELTYSRGLLGCRRWRWHELSSFKLQGRGSYRFITFVFAGKVKWFTALSPWVQGTTPDGPQSMIEDTWDIPLDEIAATLNEYRARALGGGGAETSGPRTPEPA